MSVAPILLLLAQAGTGDPAAPARPDAQCQGADGEIVVCGSRKANDRYRLKPLPPVPDGQKKAEVSLGEGMTVSAAVDPGTIPGAQDVPQVLVRFKVKF